ncbi:hypothetical protein GQ457_12G014190 [Hibiscus cannabinus]
MTRANPRGPRFDFDPKIERTQKQLNRRIRGLMVRNNNNGQLPADGQVAMPEFEAEHFELKPVMFNMLNTLGQFGGSPTENARQHLKSFLEICNSFKIHGVSNDVLKLKLFPYSLRDKAKTWNQITSFRQEDDEAMHEAWERYRDLFRRCPMHDNPPRERLEILDKLTQNDYQHPTSRRGTTRRGPAQLDSSDTILAQIVSLTNMVKNMQKQPHIQEVKALDAFCEHCGNNHDASKCGQQIESSCYDYQQPTDYKNLENTLTQFMAQTSAYMARNDRFIQKTDAFMDGTEMKLQNHDATLKSLETQVGQISQILSSRPIGGFPSNTEVAKGATHEKFKAIITRSGKILTSNQSGMAANPSAATDTPAEEDEPPQTGEDHCDPHNTTTGESSVESSHAKSEEIRPPPPFPQRLKKQKQDYQFKKFFDIFKQVHINLPLVDALQQMPNYAKFLKDMVTRKKKIEEFETAAATKTCLALMHNKVPAKKTDPGSFTIECFIGHNYPTKALCDPGASINLMPKSVFQKLGIGEAKPTTVMLRLADHSYVQPEGKIEDILVQIDKFIFPIDFLILECETNTDAPIILGRPFLATGRVLFDFENEELIFRVNDQQEEKLIEILRQQKEALGWTIADIKGIRPTICIHKILLEENHKPTVDAQRRLNQAMKDVVRKEILKWLDACIIYPISDSEWVSPIQCVPKKGGITVISNEKNELIPTRTIIGWRVCMDYRKLNKATRKDHFSLPFIDQMLDRLAGKQFYCFLDGYSGYNQIAIAPEDQSKTTFTCPYRTFAFRRMPFGLCNVPATFQRCMTAIFSDLNEDCLEIFMDDFPTFGEDFDNFLSNLEKVLIRCKETNLVLNWEKCHFMDDEGIVLVHKISSKGIEVDRAKIEVISKLPPPTTVKGIRSFLGHAGFYRRFIEDFSKITKPLCSLLEKGRQFEFNEDCMKAFNLLKQKLVSAPIVEPPYWTLPFELMCDASEYAVGAIISHRSKGNSLHRPLCNQIPDIQERCKA